MGPPPYRAARARTYVSTARENLNGWGRRARTPITRARTWRPTIRRSPSGGGHCTGASSEVSRHGADGATLLQRIPEGATRLEARNATGGDPDGLSGSRIASVAFGAPAQEERAESADSHPTAPLE